jgi:hypothetical protein
VTAERTQISGGRPSDSSRTRNESVDTRVLRSSDANDRRSDAREMIVSPIRRRCPAVVLRRTTGRAMRVMTGEASGPLRKHSAEQSPNAPNRSLWIAASLRTIGASQIEIGTKKMFAGKTRPRQRPRSKRRIHVAWRRPAMSLNGLGVAIPRTRGVRIVHLKPRVPGSVTGLRIMNVRGPAIPRTRGVRIVHLRPRVPGSVPASG